MKRFHFLICSLLLTFNVSGQDEDTIVKIHTSDRRYKIYPVDIVKSKVLVEKLPVTVKDRARENSIKPYLKAMENFVRVNVDDTAGYNREEYRYMIVNRYKYSRRPEGIYIFYDRVDRIWFDLPDKPHTDGEYFAEMYSFYVFIQKVMKDNSLTLADVSHTGAFKETIVKAEDERLRKRRKKRIITGVTLGVVGYLGVTVLINVLINQ